MIRRCRFTTMKRPTAALCGWPPLRSAPTDAATVSRAVASLSQMESQDSPPKSTLISPKERKKEKRLMRRQKGGELTVFEFGAGLLDQHQLIVMTTTNEERLGPYCIASVEYFIICFGAKFCLGFPQAIVATRSFVVFKVLVDSIPAVIEKWTIWLI